MAVVFSTQLAYAFSPLIFRQMHNVWYPTSGVGMPSIRTGNTQAVVGNRFWCKWGGENAGGTAYLSDGACFDTNTMTWVPIPAAPGAFQLRGFITSAGAGDSLFYWGGSNGLGSSVGNVFYNDGVLYNPTTQTWTYIPTSPLSPRIGATAVWTGSKVVVWGGYVFNPSVGNIYYGDGATYDPVSGVWSPIGGILSARAFASGIWTGSSVFIWGGYNSPLLGGAANYLNDGAQYTQSTNTWSGVTSNGAPSGVTYPAMAVGGSQSNEILVWGGFNGGILSGGAIYNLTSGTWQTVSTSGAPSARFNVSSYWDTQEGKFNLLGGALTNTLPETLAGDAFAYDPQRDQWTSLAPPPAPVPGDCQPIRSYYLCGADTTGIPDLYIP